MTLPRRQGPRYAMVVWWLAVIALAVLVTDSDVHGVCSAIPAPAQEFVSPLGTVDRPFASPLDPVRVACKAPGPGICPTPLANEVICDGATLGSEIACPRIEPQHVLVSVVFQPDLVTGTARRRMVVLGRAEALGSLAACIPEPGVCSSQTINCERADLEIGERQGARALEFPFPDTTTGTCVGGANADERCASDADCVGGRCQLPCDPIVRTGPAAIVVTDAASPLPDPNDPCVPRPGLLACIDELGGNAFTHFTALPKPNDYGNLCSGAKDVCAGGSRSIDATVDRDGNLLIPVDWSRLVLNDTFQGLDGNDIPLIRRIQNGLGLGKQSIELPIARLVLFETDVDAFTGGRKQAIQLPDRTYLRAYTPGGVRLPPIFEPHLDTRASNSLVLFGSVDAERSVLRIARGCERGGQCAIHTCDGGDFPGRSCTDDTQCCDVRPHMRPAHREPWRGRGRMQEWPLRLRLAAARRHWAGRHCAARVRMRPSSVPSQWTASYRPRT